MRHYISTACIAFLLLTIPLLAEAVEFGWQPLADGGIEYLVQIEPDLLNSFITDGFTSDIPPALQHELRRIHITVGSGQLPHQGDVTGPAAQPDAGLSQPAGKTEESERLELPPPPTNETPTPVPTPAPNESTGNRGNSTSAPPSSEMHASGNPPSSFPSLPFFQNELKKLEADKTPPTDHPTNAAAPVESNAKPSRSENAGAPTEPRPFAADHLEMNAVKPAALETSASPNPPTANRTATGAAPKPWLPLMAALLALFASLGANVYLSWIHIAVRAKYRALVQRSATATTAI